MSAKPDPRLGANLLRSALSAAPGFMATLLDAGAPIETEHARKSGLRKLLPPSLHGHELTRATALSISCLIAADFHGNPRLSEKAALCAALLLERGARPDGAGDLAWTPLACVASQLANDSRPGASEREARCAALIDALAKAGADMQARSPGGRTPLGFALDHGNPGMAKALIAAGADIDKVRADGRAEVSRLASAGEPGPLLLALILGANPDIPDIHGQSPLHKALSSRTGWLHPSNKSIQCAAALIRAGCSLGEVELRLLVLPQLAPALMPEVAAREARQLAAHAGPATDSGGPSRL